MASKKLHLQALEAREVPAALVGNQLVEVWGQRDTVPLPAAQQNVPGETFFRLTSAHYGVSVIDATTGAERVVYTFPETNGVATDLYKNEGIGMVGVADVSGGIEQPPIAAATDGTTLYVVTRAVAYGNIQGYNATKPTLFAIDLATGARRTVVAQLPDAVEGNYVYPGGSTGTKTNQLYLVDGKLLWGVVTPVFDPATSQQTGLPQRWYRIDPTTGAGSMVATNSLREGAVVSNDGGLIIAFQQGSGSKIVRYSVATGTASTLATTADPVSFLQPSPSGNVFAVGDGAAPNSYRIREYDAKTGALLNDAAESQGDVDLKFTLNGASYELKTEGGRDFSRPAGSDGAFAEYPDHPGETGYLGIRGDSVYMSFTDGAAATAIVGRNLKTGVETVLLDSPTYAGDYGQTFAKYGAEGGFVLGSDAVVDLTTIRQGPFGTDSYFQRPKATALVRADAAHPAGVVLGRYNWADAGKVMAAITTTPTVPPTVPPPPTLPPPPTVPPTSALSSITTLAISKAAPQVGEPVTLTAHVALVVPPGGSPDQKPLGRVKFSDNGVEIGTAIVDSSGNAKLDGVKLRIGARKITATFTTLDPVHQTGSSSAPLSFTVAKATSTTALTTNLFSNGAATLELTAQVITPYGAAPIGTVTFISGSSVLGVAQVNGNGVAKLLVTAGVHQVRATYSGSSTVGGSQSAIMTVGINPTGPPVVVVGTVVQLVVSAATVTPGQALNLSAFAVTNGPPVTSGLMRFYDGSKLLGTINLGSDGHANMSTTLSAYGTHSIKAVFVGTAAAPVGTSLPVSVEVSKKATTLSFVTSPTSTSIAKPQTIAVRVSSPQGGSPIGSVSLSINGFTVGTYAVNGDGITNVIFPNGYSVGVGNVKLEYGGSSTFAASTMEMTI